MVMPNLDEVLLEPSRDVAPSRDFFAAVLGMASHDLRQPLQVISCTHEFLASRVGASPEREHLERGGRASARLTETLDLLTEALRLYECSGNIRTQPTRLTSVLESLARELSDTAEHKGLDLDIRATRISVISHPVLLGAILRNLVRNALQYTQPGGRVQVACRRRGNTVHIEVHDTGAGVPAGKLATIFEAFKRIDSTRAEGLGLGLFIVRRAANALGHRVAVRSALGQGSCFSVIAQAAPAAGAEKDCAAPHMC
jgi:signal transduction histidine kinase